MVLLQEPCNQFQRLKVNNGIESSGKFEDMRNERPAVLKACIPNDCRPTVYFSGLRRQMRARDQYDHRIQR